MSVARLLWWHQSANSWSDIGVDGKVERIWVVCFGRQAIRACLTQSSGALVWVCRGCAPMGTFCGTFTNFRQVARMDVAICKWMPTAWARRTGVFGTWYQMAGLTDETVYLHWFRGGAGRGGGSTATTTVRAEEGRRAEEER